LVRLLEIERRVSNLLRSRPITTGSIFLLCGAAISTRSPPYFFRGPCTWVPLDLKSVTFPVLLVNFGTGPGGRLFSATARRAEPVPGPCPLTFVGQPREALERVGCTRHPISLALVPGRSRHLAQSEWMQSRRPSPSQPDAQASPWLGGARASDRSLTAGCLMEITKNPHGLGRQSRAEPPAGASARKSAGAANLTPTFLCFCFF